MEFTVSKADLVRELGLSQGVVEKKTTIPILSNVLLEARDDRLTLTATDLELGIRCSCPEKRWLPPPCRHGGTAPSDGSSAQRMRLPATPDAPRVGRRRPCRR